MNSKMLYLDSSAIVKFVVRETESRALLELMTEWPERVSSVLSRVEVLRAIRRSGAGLGDYRRGEAVLNSLGLIRLDDAVLDAAAHLRPENLRSLDAIHLATALSIRGDLAAVVTYDTRFAQAVSDHGLLSWAPA